jgi:hypothetical protein
MGDLAIKEAYTTKTTNISLRQKFVARCLRQWFWFKFEARSISKVP